MSHERLDPHEVTEPVFPDVIASAQRFWSDVIPIAESFIMQPEEVAFPEALSFDSVVKLFGIEELEKINKKLRSTYPLTTEQIQTDQWNYTVTPNSLLKGKLNITAEGLGSDNKTSRILISYEEFDRKRSLEMGRPPFFNLQIERGESGKPKDLFYKLMIHGPEKTLDIFYTETSVQVYAELDIFSRETNKTGVQNVTESTTKKTTKKKIYIGKPTK